MDIPQIVDLITRDEFTTEQLWYTKQNKSERDESKPLVEPVKELKGIMTEFVVYEFLNTPGQICKFIGAVYNTFNEAIRLYNSKKGYSDKDIFFVYKGGNILRFISNQVFYMLPGKVKDDLIAYYKDSFKKSDADFSIYINPKFPDFDKVLFDMTNLAYLLQNHLRNIFLENTADFFNFYNLTTSAKDELLNKYMEKLNNAEVIKQQIIPGSFISLKLPDASNTGRKYIPKFDFEIFFNKKASILTTGNKADPDKISESTRVNLRPIHLEQFKNEELIDLSEKQIRIYGDISQSEFIVSVNRTTTFLVSGGLISFNLIRTKVSFNAERKVGEEIILDKIDGELIDVSITNKGDYVVEHFFDHVDEHIAEYKLQEDTCEVPFRAYSIEYLISDLENILFVQNAYPWNDLKYAKRLKRLLFMYYLSLFTGKTFPNNNERILYLTLLKERVLVPAKNISPTNKQEIVNSIDQFTTLYKKYDEKTSVKNLIGRIRRLVLDDQLDVEKFKQFIDSAIENLDTLQASLAEFNSYVKTSGNIDEDTLYQGQLGGRNKIYFNKYKKYKNKYLQLKNK